MNSIGSRNRIIYFDVLRSLAIVAVVVVHAAGDVFARSIYPPGTWVVSAIFVGGAYWAVPCFLMISGALMLRSNAPLHWAHHYQKTVLRLGVPFLVWSTVYVLFYNWTGIRHVPLDVAVRMIFFTTRSTAPHLWFSYVIIGLYVAAPFVKKAVVAIEARPNPARAGWACLFLFFGIAIVPNDLSAMLNITVPYLTNFPDMVFYLGYFIAGYMLYRWPVTGRVRHMGLVVCIFFASLGYLVWFSLGRYRAGASLSERNVLFVYRSAPLFLMALSVFLFAKWQNWTGRQGRWLLNEISASAYGIYLCHMIFIKAFQKLPALAWFRQLDDTQWALIPIKAVIVFVISLLLAGALRRVPRIGWLFA